MPSVPLGDGRVWDLSNLPNYGPYGNAQQSAPQQPIKPVVKVKAVPGRLGLTETLKQAFTKERVTLALGWIWHEFIWNNAKIVLARTAHQLIDSALTGRRLDNPFTSANNWGWGTPNYWGGMPNAWSNPYGQNAAPWTQNRPGSASYGQPGSYSRNFDGYGGGSLQFSTDTDAEAVRSAAAEAVKSQGFVRLAQIIGWSGMTQLLDASMYMRGWCDTSSFHIVRTGSGVTLTYGPMVDLPG